MPSCILFQGGPLWHQRELLVRMQPTGCQWPHISLLFSDIQGSPRHRSVAFLPLHQWSTIVGNIYQWPLCSWLSVIPKDLIQNDHSPLNKTSTVSRNGNASGWCPSSVKSPIKEIQSSVPTRCTSKIQTINGKYLEVNITNILSWDTHVEYTIKKANNFLAFLWRKISRPILWFVSTVWDPHPTIYIDQLEDVQRWAARFVKGDYMVTSSTTAMMSAGLAHTAAMQIKCQTGDSQQDHTQPHRHPSC